MDKCQRSGSDIGPIRVVIRVVMESACVRLPDLFDYKVDIASTA